MELLKGETSIQSAREVMTRVEKKLLLIPEKDLTDVQIIQKKLLIGSQMKEVWNFFERLPLSARSFQLFFSKCPRIICHGKREINPLLNSNRKEQVSQFEELERALKQTRSYMETLKSLGANKEVILYIEKIEDELSERSTDLTQTLAFRFDKRSISKKFGKDYSEAFSFKRTEAENAPILFAIRVVYLVLRECRIEKPPLNIVGMIASTVITESDDRIIDIDTTSVRCQIVELTGALSFVKEPYQSFALLSGLNSKT